MKTPVQWIFVFLQAFGAYREILHGRNRTVIRNILDNSEPSTTVGTIREWVVVAPVGRIEYFFQEIRSCSNIR